jgi:hypothetical protein
MKSRLAVLALVTVCLWGREACAETIVYVSIQTAQGYWGSSYGPPIVLPNVDLEATLKVIPVFGTYTDPGSTDTFTGFADVVTKMKGTLNGEPVKLLTDHPDWLNTNNFQPGSLWFTAEGITYFLETDYPIFLLFSDGLQYVPMEGSFSDSRPTAHTPEPTPFLLLVVSLLGLAFLKSTKSA